MGEHARIDRERHYASKAQIERAIRIARDNDIRVGGFELGPDGTIRILPESTAGGGSAYDRWKASQG